MTVCVAACGSAGGPTQPAGTVFVVGPSGNFRTIGAALAVAPEGATIQVQPGTYRESVDITTAGIRLVAQGGALLEGEWDSSGGSGIRIAADAVEVRGFVVQGFDNGIGSRGAHVVIAGNEVRSCHSAFPVGWRGAGIGSIGAGTQVTDNAVHDNTGNGIVISGVDTIVRRNRVYDNGAGADALLGPDGRYGVGILAPVTEGRGFWTNPSRIEVTDNEVLRNRWGVVMDGRESPQGGIAPGSAHMIRSNRVTGHARAGIALFFTTGGRVEGNHASGNALRPMPPTNGFDLFDERPGQNTWSGNQGSTNF
jgi:hypothetical protein